jgi:predicted amidohydrolase YtcJ
MTEPVAHSARRLIVNARIATGDPRRPWADAMLLDGTTVIAMGQSAALRKRAADAEIIDAKGAVVESDGAPFI